jgi:threonine dehydratase
MGLAIGPADIEAAAARIADAVLITPIVNLERLGLFAKCESLQRTGSFKLRGATNAIRALRPRGVVTASSGNHGLAVATAARAAGIPATVVMTTDSTAYKRAAVRGLGARIIDAPPGTEQRAKLAAGIAESDGLTLIPPYDHPLVIAGQGTVGLEIAEQMPEVTCVVTPVGGGGLISGLATALRARLGNRVRIIGVEPEDGQDTVLSLAAGCRVDIPVPRTICDGARSQVPGELTFPMVQALVDEVIAVDDAEVVDAVRELASCGLVVEPTGALGVAGARRLDLDHPVCVISGRNIAADAYAALIASA